MNTLLTFSCSSPSTLPYLLLSPSFYLFIYLCVCAGALTCILVCVSQFIDYKWVGFNKGLIEVSYFHFGLSVIYNHVDFYPIRILSMTSSDAPLQEASCYLRLILYLCMNSANVNKDKTQIPSTQIEVVIGTLFNAISLRHFVCNSRIIYQ